MFRSLLELLGLVDYSSDTVDMDEEGYETPDISRNKVFERPESPSVIVCRQDNCLLFRDEIVSSLKEGKVIIADLRKMEVEEGQSFLDFSGSVVHAIQGSISRICPGVFILSPEKSFVEEWVMDMKKDNEFHPHGEEM